MNELLATGPFDLYTLKLFHLVAEHRGFTRAGQAAGLTQSAITRQIQGMEEKLGLRLFDRSTRHVRLTAEGATLHARSGAILAEVDDALQALRGKSPRLPEALRVSGGFSSPGIPPPESNCMHGWRKRGFAAKRTTSTSSSTSFPLGWASASFPIESWHFIPKPALSCACAPSPVSHVNWWWSSNVRTPRPG